MKKITDISIVILNYNSIDFLSKCLKSVDKSELGGLSIEVIVVDNASTDKSIKVIRKEYPDIKLIMSKKNLGFSAGNNLAVDKVKGKYILFLNPDTVLEKNVLLEIYIFMENHKEVGVATCRLELFDGTLDYSSHRGFPTPLNTFFYFSGIAKIFPKTRFFTGYTQGWKLDDPKPHQVDVITGAFFFVRREAGEEVDWWDEDYFWGGEDIEFSYRLSEKGWKAMYLPDLKTLHYKGVTSGIKKHTQKISTASKETKIRSAKASTQAMKTFYKKHYLQKYPKIIGYPVLFGITLLEKNRVAKA